MVTLLDLPLRCGATKILVIRSEALPVSVCAAATRTLRRRHSVCRREGILERNLCGVVCAHECLALLLPRGSSSGSGVLARVVEFDVAGGHCHQTRHAAFVRCRRTHECILKVHRESVVGIAVVDVDVGGGGLSLQVLSRRRFAVKHHALGAQSIEGVFAFVTYTTNYVERIMLMCVVSYR